MHRSRERLASSAADAGRRLRVSGFSCVIHGAIPSSVLALEGGDLAGCLGTDVEQQASTARDDVGVEHREFTAESVSSAPSSWL